MYIPVHIKGILDKLQETGYSAYLVGGSVRDHLLDILPIDYDIATSATPKEVMELFDHTIPTGIKHGTVTVLYEGVSCEVTTFRIEGKYIDHRRPDQVYFSNSIEEDLSRRDFTINAIAYDGENYVDPFSGMEDLQKKIIRTVGIPTDRFDEDALRMMRAIRFAAQLGFELDKQTEDAIIAHSSSISQISLERIRDELLKIIMSDDPSRGIRLLSNLNLLKWFIPELEACKDFDQKNPYHDKDVLEHILAVVEHSPRRHISRLAALFHDIGKPPTFSLDQKGVGHFYRHDLVGAQMTNVIMKRMKFTKRTIDIVTTLVREHMCRFTEIKRKPIKKLINRVGIENLDYFFDLQIADIKGHTITSSIDDVLRVKEAATQILELREPIKIKDLDINGNDLIQLGYKPNKKVGEILTLLLERVLEEPELNHKPILIEIAKQQLDLLKG